ncbi:hypothetical protein [Sphingobacterium sp. DR205]|uniref:hypothetical protein n=1 Tax=Sphingobacterium sp. DR205 TaxID=2713573 RepID=UPI0013E4D9A4|nr:hypothetical protein [Sphingobacterium sp. DR205]QIH32236.1 hypothetical protein G6053_04670 [Sphingobacterium sp. DR205]
MKKITLKSIKNQEILSRDELKKITGGSDGSGAVGCAGKREWDSCTQSNGNIGKCQYLPFNSGLVCFRN